MATKTNKDNQTSMKDLYADGAKEKKADAKSSTKYSRAYAVLKKPLITEKGSIMAGENKYIFQVATDANKIEVAKAIESVYGVKPVKVNIVNTDGKVKRYGRIVGQRSDWKKAIVTLPEGKTISVYEGI